MRENIVSFLIKTSEEIGVQVKEVGESVKQLNASINEFTEKLSGMIVEMSQNFQSLAYNVQESRNTQFNVVFSIFTRHMEALEEIRDIALNFSDEQKEISQDTLNLLALLRRKMLDYEFQTFISNLRDLIQELKREGEK